MTASRRMRHRCSRARQDPTDSPLGAGAVGAPVPAGAALHQAAAILARKQRLREREVARQRHLHHDSFDLRARTHSASGCWAAGECAAGETGGRWVSRVQQAVLTESSSLSRAQNETPPALAAYTIATPHAGNSRPLHPPAAGRRPRCFGLPLQKREKAKAFTTREYRNFSHCCSHCEAKNAPST